MRILVGASSCGISAGADGVIGAIDAYLESVGRPERAERTGCIGMCFAEVLVEIINGCESRFYGRVTPEAAASIIKGELEGSIDESLIVDAEKFLSGQKRIVLRNCGRIIPSDIDDCMNSGDSYKALQKIFLERISPEDVIREIEISGLRGRGGGGFPTFFKWRAVRNSEGSCKHIICNADEGDPGAFMDRSVLESDPHSVIEGMTIAGFAAGASCGHIYLRAEYPLAVMRMKEAVRQAEERGVLGENILGSDFSFSIEIKEGAGAFVCGEETALIASMEGRRGMPVLRPPYPAQKGFCSEPTCINNVETLANVPWIIYNGGDAFAKAGVGKSRGTKVFAVAGKVMNPGLVEIEMGTSIHDLVFGICGGLKDSRPLKAVQLGGPSGGCIPASLDHLSLDYETIKETGAIMGSGGMIVLDDSSCMVDLARYFLTFTQSESCGKCTFCRVGTRRMLEILEKAVCGKASSQDIERLEDLALSVKKSSLCGLGQSAPNPVLTSLKYFRSEYDSHISGSCPSLSCRELVRFFIDSSKCRKCGACFKKCPAGAIVRNDSGFAIDHSKCVKCASCFNSCRFGAVSRG